MLDNVVRYVILFFLCVCSRRQFPQFGGGHRNSIPTKKRALKSYFVPKTTFTTNFCCITKRRSETTPSTSEMLYLNSVGLGKRRIVFEKKDGDHFYLIRVLEQQFPHLIPLDGGFLLFRATSGGGGCRPLIQIPMDTDGYSLTWLRNSCNISSSSTVYIVPVQQDTEGKVMDSEVVSFYNLASPYCSVKLFSTGVNFL